ncbi:MAG: carboxypeptidase-like regulatory domain-containing protein, partial [Bacteroidota bacterium]|nr:carboxypeptidase-like regulatory domain-containing protein [Bacteroidota bacterium]
MSSAFLYSAFLRSFIFFIFFSISIQLSAQNKFTVSGIVKDKQTGELLIGASVKLEGTNNNAITNGYGFYSITASQNDYTISFNY